MRPITTNELTREDVDKIKSVIQHSFNPEKYNLYPGVVKEDNKIRVDGIAHLSEEIIHQIQQQEYFSLARYVIEDELFNIEKKSASRIKLQSVTKLPDENSPVYDISMRGVNHYFFGNGILLHNTDSVYFSAHHIFEEKGIDFDWTDKDKIIDLYVAIGQEVGKTFPPFMMSSFNTSPDGAKIIDADLEMIGSNALFLKKKRYGVLKFWEDGFRLDVNGKPGKLKAVGVEIKRSDTPKNIQVFLEDIFVGILSGITEKELRARVFDFKSKFKDIKPWMKGTPKTVKNLTNKTVEYEETGKCGVGHVLAAINWNKLRSVNRDMDAPEISDGNKTLVCKLKQNIYGFTSIGIPIECTDRAPSWFTSLPFDTDQMDITILAQKMENIFGALDMDLGINENVNTTINNEDLFGWD